MNRFWFHVKHLVLLFLFTPVFSFSQHFSTTTFEVKPFPKIPAKEKGLLNLLQQNPIFGKLTDEQKEWFYWTNVLRQKPIFFYDSVIQPILNVYPKIQSNYAKSLKKDLCETQPLALLSPNGKLITLSQGHADDLFSHKKSPSHNSTNGDSFQQRMIKGEINRCAAENISYGPSNPIMALVLLLIDEGLPDLGHRKNLLSPGYVEMGIGISNYPDNLVLVVQDFACSQAL